MKVLILGGSGHVSGAVARAALSQGHEVWALTRGQRPLADGIHSLVADRHDLAVTEAAVTAQDLVWDLVVDCICYDVADMQQDLDLFPQRARQLALVSTDFVYDPAHRTFPQPEEATHWASGPEGSLSYGQKKRQCELELSGADTGDMGWTVVRPCHIYGPTSQLGCLPLHGRDPELLAKMRAGEALRLVGGGHFLQQPILADDLALVLLSVGGNEAATGKIFNAAGPDTIESWFYYQIIADVLGVELSVEEVPVREHLEAHPEAAPFLCHRVCDLSRLEAADLHRPSTPVEEGLRLHVEGLLAGGGP
ncbi:NAD-dependent epimerase/dehydratase family protein [Candidatus Latescibacterota bacterium]